MQTLFRPCSVSIGLIKVLHNPERRIFVLLSPLLHSVALVAIYIKSPLRIEVRIPCMAYLKDVISGYSTVPTPGS